MDTFEHLTALLVIDVQEGFRDPAWGERNNPNAEANIQLLLDGFRVAGLPVIHVRHDSQSAAGRLRPGTVGNEVMPFASELDGERVHRKTVNSAFIRTNLQVELREAEIGTLVLVGLTTNHRVSTTARMAGNLGFETYVVSDATAAFERAHVDGRMRPAEDVHQASLSDLDDEFATVVDTRGILGMLESRFVAKPPVLGDAGRKGGC